MRRLTASPTVDRTVLVRHADVVARRCHIVMRTQLLTTMRQILRRPPLEIAERRREAVAAMLRRRSAESPQRILQAFSQGDEAFPAEHDPNMFPTGERQAEVVQPMLERDPGNGDRKAEASVKSDSARQCSACWQPINGNDFLDRRGRRPLRATQQRAVKEG